MTTIAWDGKTLAGDKQTTYSGVPVRTTKVFAVEKGGRRWLFGCAGNTGQCKAFRSLVLGDIEKLDMSDIEVLCVDDTGQLWFTENSLNWADISPPYWAIGSGHELAMGAMAQGATARRAVEVATLHDVNTGLGVDVVEWEPAP